MDELRSQLEAIGLSADQIEEVLPLLSQPDEAPTSSVPSSSLDMLREEVAMETDPIRKAQLAARVISRSLD